MNDNFLKYKDMYKAVTSMQQESRELKKQSEKIYRDSCALTKKSRDYRAQIINDVARIICESDGEQAQPSSVLDIATYILGNDDKVTNKSDFLYRSISKKVRELKLELQK